MTIPSLALPEDRGPGALGDVTVGPGLAVTSCPWVTAKKSGWARPGRASWISFPSFPKEKIPPPKVCASWEAAFPKAGWVIQKKGEWLVRGVLILLSRGSLENVGFLINLLFLISFKNII